MPSGDEVFSLVIFGASGDLTNRKLLPALWSLYSARTLPEPFAIIGTARSEMTDEAFRAKMKDGVKQFAGLKVPSDNVWDRFAASLYYVAGDPSSPDLYAKLRQRLESIESKHGDAGNRLYYLSDAAQPLCAHHHAARQGGPRRGAARLDPHHHREAVRPRSRLPLRS